MIYIYGKGKLIIMASERKNKVRKSFLGSKKLWAPVLLLILFVLLYISAAPYGVFTTVPSKEAANTIRTENVQLQQTAQINLLTEKKIFTKENIRITDSEFQQQLKTFLLSRYGINANDLKLEKSLGTAADKKFVYFAQVYKDVPVYSSRSTFFIRNNELAYMKLNYHKIENLDVNPKINKDEAFARIKKDMEDTSKNMFFVANIEMDKTDTELEPYMLNSKIQKKYYDIEGKQRQRDFSKLTSQVIATLVPESSELVVYPYKNTYYLAYKVVMPTIKEVPMKPVYFVDGHTGNIINMIDALVFYDVSGTVSLYEWEDPFTDYNQIAQPSAHNRVSLNNQQTETTFIGTYQLTGLTEPGTLTSYLEGPWVSVNNAQQPSAMHSAWIEGQTIHNWDWGNNDNSYLKEEENAFFHVNVIHDYITYYGATEMDYLMIANVNIPSHCNAYYDGASINFFEAGDECESTAVISDVIYHEYGHGIIHTLDPSLHYIGGYWGESGNIHEGLSDYWACTINNNPNMSEGFFVGDPEPLRICNSDDRYPEDYDPEPHAGAQIISGAMWDIREVIGKEVIDPLLVNALRLQPITFSELVEALVVADDDNNNLSDGTPNITTICDSFYAHGITTSACAGFTSQPLAIITSPTNLEQVDDIINVVGTAYGSVYEEMTYYVIEYNDAGEWKADGISLAGNGENPISDDVLGTWNTKEVNDGDYPLRLTVYTQNTQSEFMINITLKNNHILQPAEGDILRPGYIIDVIGTIHELDFEHYTVEWARDGGQFTSEGITLANGGEQPVYNGLIAQWDTSIINETDDYELRVLVTRTGRNTEIIPLHLFFDPTLRQGWPVGLGHYDYENCISSYSSVFTDVNQNGDNELIIYGSGNVFVFKNDGTLLDGWPQSLGGCRTCSTGPTTPASVGDIDGDDENEIVIPRYSWWGVCEYCAYAWNADGSPVDGWPIRCTDFENDDFVNLMTGTAVLSDLDNDLKKEIIINYEGGYQVEKPATLAFKGNGEYFGNWPFIYNDIDGFSPIFAKGSPAVGDVDCDRESEIVTLIEGDINGQTSVFLYILSANGELERRSLIALTGLTRDHHPVLADLDNDCDLEIIFETNFGGLWVVHHTGENYEGWPLSWNEQLGGQLSVAKSESGNFVIYFGDWGSTLIAVDADNQVIWSKNTMSGGINVEPTTTDANNDESVEIFTTAFTGKVFGLTAAGEDLQGFPKTLMSESQSGVTIGDLDNNGRMEIAAADWTPRIYVWDLPWDTGQEEWPMFRHDAQHTGLYIPSMINATFHIKEPSGSYAGRLLRINADDYYYSEYITEPVNIIVPREASISILLRNQTQQGWDMFTVGWTSNTIVKEMNATTDYLVNPQGYTFPIYVAYAISPTWQRSNASVFTQYNISRFVANLSQITLYGCSTWNYAQRRCTSGWTELRNVIKQWDGLSSLDSRVFNAYAIGRKITGGKSLPYEQGQTGI